MNKFNILLFISIFVIAVAIITLLSIRIELLQDSIVKILLSLCTVFGVLIGKIFDNFYYQSEKKEREEMNKEVEKIGKE